MRYCVEKLWREIVERRRGEGGGVVGWELGWDYRVDCERGHRVSLRGIEIPFQNFGEPQDTESPRRSVPFAVRGECIAVRLPGMS